MAMRAKTRFAVACTLCWCAALPLSPLATATITDTATGAGFAVVRPLPSRTHVIAEITEVLAAAKKAKAKPGKFRKAELKALKKTQARLQHQLEGLQSKEKVLYTINLRGPGVVQGWTVDMA